MKKREICPNCQRVLRRVNAFHNCKRVEIDELFVNKPDVVLLAFDTLSVIISTWDDVEMSATKNCIVFVRDKTFVVAKPMSRFLEIKFYSNDWIEDEGLHKCRLWSNKYECIIRVQSEDDFTPKHFDYFRKSYLIS
jgi:hypothetical protein